jgi:hypothetical protein
MAIGRTGSFATTQAPTDNILQSMQYVDQLDYRAKQDKAKEDAAKAKAEAEKDLEFKGSLEKAKAVLTGKRGYDAPIISAVSLLSENLADAHRDYRSGKMSKTEYEIKNNNILGQVDLMSQKSKLIIDQQKTLTKMIEDGKVADGFENTGIELSKAMEEGSIIPEMDSNGNVIFTAWKLDENGKPTDIIEKNQLSDFGNVSFSPVANIDFQEELKVFKGNNPLGLIESISGLQKTGVKELSPTTDKNIKAYAEAKVRDKDALSVAYRNATGSIERNITDPDKIKKAEDWIYQNFKDSYTKEVFKGEATQAARLAEEKRKNRLEEEDDKPSYNIVETPPQYGELGVAPAKGYKTVSVTQKKQTPVNNIVGKVDGKDVIFNNVILNSYTVEKDANGKRSVVAQITYPDVKTSTLTPAEKNKLDFLMENPDKVSSKEDELFLTKVNKGAEYKTKVVRLNEKDVVKFKGAVGANNANEMKDLARVGKEEKYDEYGVEIK